MPNRNDGEREPLLLVAWGRKAQNRIRFGTQSSSLEFYRYFPHGIDDCTSHMSTSSPLQRDTAWPYWPTVHSRWGCCGESICYGCREGEPHLVCEVYRISSIRRSPGALRELEAPAQEKADHALTARDSMDAAQAVAVRDNGRSSLVGITRLSHLEENLDVKLGPDDVRRLDQISSKVQLARRPITGADDSRLRNYGEPS
jgi:hypothetical protein